MRVQRIPDDRTIRPMTSDERALFIERVRALPDTIDDRWPWPPRRVLLFLYYTGAHPEVLVHPRRRHLVVREDHLQWFRPKNRKPMSMPITDNLRPWIEEFVAGLREPQEHKFVTSYYRVKGMARTDPLRARQQDVCYLPVTYLVKRVSVEIGLPGLSPRGIRHDRGERIRQVRGDLADVQNYLGTTPSVAARYVAKRNEQVDFALQNEGADRRRPRPAGPEPEDTSDPDPDLSGVFDPSTEDPPGEG